MDNDKRIYKKSFFSSLTVFATPIFAPIAIFLVTVLILGGEASKIASHLPEGYMFYVAYYYVFLFGILVSHYLLKVRPYSLEVTESGIRERIDILGNVNSTHFSRMCDIRTHVSPLCVIFGVGDISFLNKEDKFQKNRQFISGLPRKDTKVIQRILESKSFEHSRISEMEQNARIAGKY